MWFDHHCVVSISSSLSCLCWERILLIDIVCPNICICVIPKWILTATFLKWQGCTSYFIYFPAKFCSRVIEAKHPNCKPHPPSQSPNLILFCFWFMCDAPKMSPYIWDSVWCHNAEGLPLTQISSWTSRPHCQLGEAFTCQESSSSADRQWLLNSTILRTRQQNPLVYGIVSISSFSSCVHRVLLTIFAIICLRGHGKWCLCPPRPFCIKLIFGTA